MADKLTKSQKPVEIDESLVYNSVCDRNSGEIVFTKADGSEVSMNLNGATAGDISDVMLAHKDIYEACPSFNNIIHNASSEVVAVSRLGKTMKPLLDDFAQIVGVTVKHAGYNPNNSLATSKKVVKALKGRNAVLLENNGALCVAGSEYDAGAIEFITNKGAKIQVSAKMFDKVEPINPLETRIMNLVYRLKYSKQAGK